MHMKTHAKLFHAIILSARRSTADKIIACNYCIWNHSLISRILYLVGDHEAVDDAAEAGERFQDAD